MKLKLSLLLILMIFVTACAPSKSANVYSRKTAMQSQTVEQGTVESVKTVLIEGTKTPVGTTVGAVTGGVLGSTIGSYEGKENCDCIRCFGRGCCWNCGRRQINTKTGS